MTTATTTLEAIRDGMITILEGLAPSIHSSVKFEKELGEIGFEMWAENNPASAFRRFSLLRTGAGDWPSITNTDVEERTERVVLVIAYPRTFAKYGDQNVRDCDDVIDADLRLIDGQSGIGRNNSAGYVSGQNSSFLVESETEEGEAVRFAHHTFEVSFYQGVSA